MSQNVKRLKPCQTFGVKTRGLSPSEQKVDAILRASLKVFAERGFRRASMSIIAEAAGVSRPALYQYFTDRADLFAAAFRLFVEENTTAALNALDADVPLAEQIDGYLQRLHGDPYAALAATAYGDEIIDAHHQFAAGAIGDAVKRAQAGLRKHLQTNTKIDRKTIVNMSELLTLSIAGFKQDRPTPATYRRRLKFLAKTVADSVTNA